MSAAKAPGMRTAMTRSVIAGLGASLVTTMVVHPFDLLRARRQGSRSAAAAAAGKSGASSSREGMTLSSIVRNEGVAGLYRGLSVHLIGHLASSIVFYTAEVVTKRMFGTRDPNFDSLQSDLPWYNRFGRKFASSALAGCTQVMATHPVWVVKNRLQLSRSKATGAELSWLSELVRMGREEGFWKCWYSGLGPSVMLTLHTAAQWALYDETKRAIMRARNGKKLNPVEHFLAGSVSKVVSVSISNPMMVVRTRLMEKNARNTSSLKEVARIWRDEGFLAFYRGTSAMVMKIIASGITSSVYESGLRLLHGL